jgi:hypothetical protein
MAVPDNQVNQKADDDEAPSRGSLLLWDAKEWGARNHTLIVKNLSIYIIPPMLMFIVLWIWIMVSASGSRLLFDFQEEIVNILFVIAILLMLIYGIYRVYMGRPLGGIYENGIGLPGGRFIPYQMISSIERNQRYGILGADVVVIHSREWTGGPWVDPHPRLPFWFLKSEGLKEIMRILNSDPSRGHSLKEEPELVVYGSNGHRG